MKNLALTLLACLLALLVSSCSKQAKQHRHLARANKYYDAGDFEKARIEYINVLRLGGENPTAIKRIGLIHFDRGEINRAVPYLVKAEELDADDVKIRWQLARVYLLVRQTDKARKEAIAILDRQPTNDEAIVFLADASATPEQLKDTATRLATLEGKIGDRPSFHVARANQLLKSKDVLGAEQEVKKALAMDPKYGGAALALATVCSLQNRLNEAETNFEYAVSLNPTDVSLAVQLASFKSRLGKMEEAKNIAAGLAKTRPDFLPVWILSAQLAFASKDYDHCMAFAKKALDRDPSNFEGQMFKAAVSSARGDVLVALKELESIAAQQQYQRVPQLHYHLGLAHLRNNDVAKAQASLSQAVTLDPNFSEAVVALAELNLRKNDAASAISMLNQLIKQRPSGPAYLLLAAAYRAQHDYDQALYTYRRIEEAMPKEPQVPWLMGLTYLQQGKKTDARTFFDKALNLKADYLPAVEQLIYLDVAEKHYASASNRVAQLLLAQPKAPEPHQLLASVYFGQGNTNAAEAELLKAIELDPNFHLAHSTLVQLYVSSGRQGEALKRLNEAVAKNPKDITALTQIGLIYEQTRDFPAARTAYEKLLAVNPRSPVGLNNLAYIYCEHLNDLDKAYDLAQKARDLMPNQANTADTFGWILVRRGDYGWARTVLDEAAEKLNDPEAFYHLAMANYMLGDEVGARTAFERALASPRVFNGKADAEARLAFLRQPIEPTTAGIAALEKQFAAAPKDPVVLMRLAASYERARQPEKAKDACEKALKLNAKNVAAIVTLARLHATAFNDSATAMKLAKEARTLAPDDPQVGHTLGRLAFNNRDHQWAFSLLSESARKEPGDVGLLYDLAWSQFSVGRLADAESTMRTAVQTNASFAQSADAKRFISLLAGLKSSPASVANDAAAALKENPQYGPALLVTAAAADQGNNHTAARDAYNQVLATYPLLTPAMRALAIIYAEHLKDDARAIELGVKARETYRDDPELARALGKAYYRQKDNRNAARFLAESARTHTNDAEIFYLLGLAHHELKQSKESTNALKQALALNSNDKLAGEARRILGSTQ